MAKSNRVPNYAEPGEDIWVEQRILDFAPDEASIPAAQKVLKKGGFGTVEATADGKGWWVVCQGITDVYQTSVRIDDGSFECDCTCPSPKYPCKHALALLLYLLDHPEERAEPEAPKHAATDFEALVRAVFQNPDDDTPRLIFADFLEENDQPDRAALIRTQCALAREKKSSDRAGELRKEAGRLGRKLHEQVVGTLPEGMRAEFRRGFLHLYANLHSFRDVGALPERFTRLFRDGWVETFHAVGYMYDLLEGGHATLLGFVGELDFSETGMTEDALVALVTHAAEMKATGRLCRVQVAKRDRKAFEDLTAAQAGGSGGSGGRVEEYRQHRGLTRQSLDLLIRAGRLRAARRLVLDGSLGNAEAELLAAADLGGVEELHLSRWHFGPDGMAALSNSAGLGRLTTFGVTDTRLDPAHITALAGGPAFAGLRALFLGSTFLTDSALAELGRATRFRALESLDLEINSLTPKGVAAFLRSPNFPALTAVSITANDVEYRDLLPLVLGAGDRPRLTLTYAGLTMTRESGPDGVRISVVIPTRLRTDLFAGLAAGAAGRVRGFSASRAEVTPKGLRALARALAPDALKELELRDVSLKNEGVEELLAAFKDFRPETLRLPLCRVQAGGAAALAGSPVLDGVKVLDLTGNTIGKAGAAALVKSPHLGGLERLELTRTKVGPEEAKALKAKFGRRLVL